MAVAANARVSLYDGGQYLLARLQPETPHGPGGRRPQVRQQPDGHRRAVDLGHSELRPGSGRRGLKEADTANATITNLCK